MCPFAKTQCGWGRANQKSPKEMAEGLHKARRHTEGRPCQGQSGWHSRYNHTDQNRGSSCKGHSVRSKQLTHASKQGSRGTSGGRHRRFKTCTRHWAWCGGALGASGGPSASRAAMARLLRWPTLDPNLVGGSRQEGGSRRCRGAPAPKSLRLCTGRALAHAGSGCVPTTPWLGRRVHASVREVEVARVQRVARGLGVQHRRGGAPDMHARRAPWLLLNGWLCGGGRGPRPRKMPARRPPRVRRHCRSCKASNSCACLELGDAAI